MTGVIEGGGSGMYYQKLLSRFYAGTDAPGAEAPFPTTPPEGSPLDACNDDPPVAVVSPAGPGEFDFSSRSDEADAAPAVAGPLSPDCVRWFYKANDDKIWTEFDGYDSLLIENKYREFCSIHSPVQADLSGISADNDGIEGSPRKFPKTALTVRGGMYEIYFENMTCESIYWPGEQCSITRGLYFYDGSWQPLEGRHGEVLEEEHLKLFGEDANALPQNNTGIAVHSYPFADFHVEWLSPVDIYLYWGGAPRQLVRSVSQKLGFYQSTGYRLKRGYKTKASNAERPPEISNVVFVVHGIGQKMDSGRIIRNTNALRANFDWLRNQYPKCVENNGRAELFPAKWRAGDRGDASDLLAAAAPLGAPALRRAINDAAMDVMYYTSPVYGKHVQDDLTQELNRLYTEFMARNPNYKGNFSAVAHSLGCVILYDIITGFQIGCEKCAEIDNEQNRPKTKLLFELEQLFCVGSPLGVFLALRQSTSESQRILPLNFNTRLYNIFHLSDPVAYRLEPLIARWLADHPPLVIPPHYSAPPANRGTWKIWSYVKHPWQRSETGSPIPNAENLYMNGNHSKNVSAENSPKKINTVGIDNEPGEFNDKNIYTDLEEDSLLYDNMVSAEVPRSPEEVLPYRIDYTLKDSFITNNYIWAITSHTSYWNNYDVAYFILTHLRKEGDELQDGDRDVSSN